MTDQEYVDKVYAIAESHAEKIGTAIAYIDAQPETTNSELHWHLQRIKTILSGDDDGGTANGGTHGCTTTK